MAESIPRIKRPRVLGLILTIVMITQGVTEAILFGLLASGAFDWTDLNEDYGTYRLIAFLAVLSILGFILLMFWIWRIVRNSELAGIEHLASNANWSVGWWLIPVVNLFVPYIVLSEVFRANQDPVDWRKRDHPAATVGLWLATLIQTPISILSHFITSSDGNIDPNSLHIALYGLGTTRMLCLAYIVVRIGGFQKHLALHRPQIDVF